jgi:hypothetical protein
MKMILLWMYLAYWFGIIAIHIWVVVGEEKDYPFKRTFLCGFLAPLLVPVMLCVYIIYRICGAIKKRWDEG